MWTVGKKCKRISITNGCWKCWRGKWEFSNTNKRQRHFLHSCHHLSAPMIFFTFSIPALLFVVSPYGIAIFIVHLTSPNISILHGIRCKTLHSISYSLFILLHQVCHSSMAFAAKVILFQCDVREKVYVECSVFLINITPVNNNLCWLILTIFLYSPHYELWPFNSWELSSHRLRLLLLALLLTQSLWGLAAEISRVYG